MADVKELFKKLRENPDQLSEEELKELMAVSGQDDDVPPKKPEETPPKEKARVTLEDGTVLEADSYEDLSKTLTAKLGEHYKEPPKESAAQPAVQPKFEMEKFTQLFVKDAREGMDYLETTQYGFPVSKAMPLVVQAMGKLAEKVQVMEGQRFLDTHQDYEPSPENQRVIEGIIANRGWKAGYEAFSDAFAIAKSAGMIKAKATKKEDEPPKEQPFVPPRTNVRGQSGEGDLLAAAEKMSLDKLEALLIESGYLKRGRM